LKRTRQMDKISQGLKVTGWIINGKPSQYGIEVNNKKIIPMKKFEWKFLHRLWMKLSEPLMYYHESDSSVEFSKK